MSNNKRTPPTVINLPAPVKKRSQQNLFRPFETLAELTDELIEEFGHIQVGARLLERLRSSGYIYWKEVPQASDIEVSDFFRERLARARAVFVQLDGIEFYEIVDDDDEERSCLLPSIIAERLALMLTAFPTQPSERFPAMLLQHVVALRISRLALMSACAELEISCARPPPISTVVETMRVHDDRWCKRRWAIQNMLGTAARAAENLAIVQEKLAEQERKRKFDEAISRLNEAFHQQTRVRGQIRDEQDAAAKIADRIADGFCDLMHAEAEIEDAARDLDSLSIEDTK